MALPFSPRANRLLPLPVLVLAVLACAGGPAAAQNAAQGAVPPQGPAQVPGKPPASVRLDARYTLTLAGLTIGKGNWTIDVSDTRYSSVASGGATGLLRTFTGGQGKTLVEGTWQGGRPGQTAYDASITSSKKTDQIKLTVSNGAVKNLDLNPPVEREPDRVPVTAEDQVGILDPVTASLVRMPGTTDLLSPEACQRKMAVFDGRMRYDLQLAYKRMDKVKAAKGYEGPVVVCSVYFAPVAGHIPSRATIKYLVKERDMEVWLAPINGTRFLVPFRASSPTPIGAAVLEATQFVSLPGAGVKAAASGSKPQ